MIDSRELRIGNYVTDQFFDTFKTFIKVYSINNKGINLEIEDDGKWAEIAKIWIGCEYSFKSLFGIPLTEEILLKCGFSITESIFHDNTNAYEIKSWGRIVLINGILQSDEFYFLDGLSTEIKYLHQLQNLYFALTNEELTIQL